MTGWETSRALPPTRTRGYGFVETPSMMEGLYKRPVIENPDGSISTVRTNSYWMDDEGLEVLIPMMSHTGRTLSPDEAVALYRQTGEHLGKFRTWQEADQWAEDLHKEMARFYTQRVRE